MQKEEREKIISNAVLKILVGGLLVYYAYALASDLGGAWETKQIVLAFFAILFVLVGIYFAGTGGFSLVKLYLQKDKIGESEGGAEKEQEEQSNEPEHGPDKVEQRREADGEL